MVRADHKLDCLFTETSLVEVESLLPDREADLRSFWKIEELKLALLSDGPEIKTKF